MSVSKPRASKESTTIPGYAMGAASIPRAPLSLEELDLLKKTVLFGPEDEAALRKSGEILRPQADALLDVWYGFVGSNPHLLHYFTNARTGEPDTAYLAAVRERFKQWIFDTASAKYDQAWLDYQFEIGRRHHRTAKNRTDRVESVPHIPFRYVAALYYPVITTIRPFLAKGASSPEELDRMQEAWRKSVLLQVILWSYPYVKDGDF